MCVRNYLLQSHQGTTYFTTQDKQNFATNFAKDCQPLCITGNFYLMVYNTMLPQVLKMHTDAYAKCCCPGSPAAKKYWAGIFFAHTQIFLKTFGCPAEVQQIEACGPCGCDNW